MLDVGRTEMLVAAVHPRQPFILEPDKKSHDHSDLVYAGQPPVGEYEFLLYRGHDPLTSWDAEAWEQWLNLAIQRLRQLQRNPHLGYAYLSINTAVQHSLSGWLRVGDLVATSHPVNGVSVLIDRELAAKIAKKEALFIVRETGHGMVIVPSAPTHDNEVWYFPKVMRPLVHGISKEEKQELAETLSVLARELKTAFTHQEFTFTFHTDLVGDHQESSWWLQIYRSEAGVESPVPLRGLPELFVSKLRGIL